METSEKRIRKRASVTLVSLCMTTSLGIALGTYLSLCTRSGQFSTRMLHQEKAQELAQVGMEEALWALNQNNWSESGPGNNMTWTTSGADRNVVLSYSLPGGTLSGEVTVRVTNYANSSPPWPAITSTAIVTLPGGQTFTKSLQASSVPAPLFGNAIASAEAYVSFAAGGIVDSWNSDPDNNPATALVPYSFTAGNAANYAAVVAGRSDGTYGVVLTQATVRGYVATFGERVSYSTSGSPPGSVVGPATPSGVRIDAARLGKSAFVPVAPVFNIFLPATNGPNFGGVVNNTLQLASALLSLPTADVYETSGDLIVDGSPLVSPSVTIDRPIKLIVNGALTISQTGSFTVTPTGSLQIFVTGDAAIGGDGLQNQTGDAKKLALFATGNSTNSLRFTSTQDFCGVMFSEHRPIDIRQNATFYGALLSRRYVRFSANATAPIFHYDTALRQTRFSNVTTPYLLQQITEL